MIQSERKRRTLGVRAVVIIAAGLTGWGAVPPRAEKAPAPASIPGADLLVALNEHFHEAYRRARIDRLARIGTVVLVKFDGLTLLRHGRRTEVPFPSTLYHDLKNGAHVPQG